EWLALRQTRKTRHGYLFVREGGRRVGDKTLSTSLEEIKAIAGLKGDPRIRPHSIRHAAATRLLRNGADIRSIQTWLGHSDLKTTAIYLHSDEQQIRAVAHLAAFRPQLEQHSPTPVVERQPDRHAFFQQRRRIDRKDR